MFPKSECVQYGLSGHCPGSGRQRFNKKLGLFARMGRKDWETVSEALRMVGMENI